ncbi:MAG: hypothetical protein GY845_31275 [Planctomycetes bacterium]|nr:hypothetical protein [Planctomycetota bacterium]
MWKVSVQVITMKAKYQFYLLISLLSLFLWACAPSMTLSPDPITGGISGRVIDSSSGGPIPAANISTDPPSSSVTADAQGNYSISDVPPGNYMVTGIKSGFTSATVTIAVGANATTTADLHLIANPTNASVCSTPDASLADGLIAYYPFDGNAGDQSDNGNHGQEYGGVEYVDGKMGKAVRFDGVDDYIMITPRSDVSAIGDFTIAVWTYHEGWKDQINLGKDRQYVFDGHSHSNTVALDFYREGFGIIYDGKLDAEEIHNFIMYDVIHGRDTLEQNTQMSVSERWRFIVFLRRGENDYTYVDGQLITPTYYRANREDTLLNMNHNWFIGTFSGNNPNYGTARSNYSFYGLIDELYIYNRALSPVEIEMLYEKSQQ